MSPPLCKQYIVTLLSFSQIKLPLNNWLWIFVKVRKCVHLWRLQDSSTLLIRAQIFLNMCVSSTYVTFNGDCHITCTVHNSHVRSCTVVHSHALYTTVMKGCTRSRRWKEYQCTQEICLYDQNLQSM